MTALPVLGMLGTVLFPGMRGEILLCTPRSLAAVRASIERGYGGRLAIFGTRTGSSDPEPEDLYTVGTFGQLHCLKRCRCCGRWRAAFRGVARIRTVEYLGREPFRVADVEVLNETADQSAFLKVLASELHRVIVGVHACWPRWRPAMRARAALLASPAPDELPGCVVDLLSPLSIADRQALLEVEPLTARLEAALAHVHGLLSHVMSHGPGQEIHRGS